MDTVVRPRSIDDEVGPDLLLSWGNRQDDKRIVGALIASVCLHVVLIPAVSLIPQGAPPAPRQETVRRITPLIAPLRELTQPTPNKGPISKEITAEQLLPRPRIQVPPSPRSTTRAAALKPAIPTPTPSPAPALPEPPRIEAGARSPESPKVGNTDLARALPAAPQIQAQEKPKMALENVGEAAPPAPKAGGQLQVPNATVSEAIRSAARGGSSGGLVVGDVGPPDVGGIGEGLNLPPSPGRQASNLELLSDPMGVDFRPYLIRILSTVRRNWFAVMPESATKLGRRGKVVIQFAVNRDGGVPKLVIVSGSGADSLDRAAVAGISASNPFPPLPSEFKGSQIRLQFNFVYNMPRN